MRADVWKSGAVNHAEEPWHYDLVTSPGAWPDVCGPYFATQLDALNAACEALRERAS